jgi:hypothetical protein
VLEQAPDSAEAADALAECGTLVELLQNRQAALAATLEGAFPELRATVWQSEATVQAAVQVRRCLEGLAVAMYTIYSAFHTIYSTYHAMCAAPSVGSEASGWVLCEYRAQCCAGGAGASERKMDAVGLAQQRPRHACIDRVPVCSA